MVREADDLLEYLANLCRDENLPYRVSHPDSGMERRIPTKATLTQVKGSMKLVIAAGNVVWDRGLVGALQATYFAELSAPRELSDVDVQGTPLEPIAKRLQEQGLYVPYGRTPNLCFGGRISFSAGPLIVWDGVKQACGRELAPLLRNLSL